MIVGICIGIVIGIMVGIVFGLLIASWLVVAKDADEQAMCPHGVDWDYCPDCCP